MELSLQTRYITLDEFQEYFNIDLVENFGSTEAALAFLKRIEDRLSVYCDAKFNRNIDKLYPEFTDYQKEHYKLALLEQTIYIFKNGDLSVDSGFDPEKGEVGKPENYAIAPNCKNNLILCGIWNRNVRPRNTLFGPGWWFR